VLEDVLKAGSCIQGVGAHCLGHSSAELWVRGESRHSHCNSAGQVGGERESTSELSCGGISGCTVRNQTAKVQQPVAF